MLRTYMTWVYMKIIPHIDFAFVQVTFTFINIIPHSSWMKWTFEDD